MKYSPTRRGKNMTGFKRTNLEGIDIEDSPFEIEDYFSILHTYKLFKEDNTGATLAPELIRKYKRSVSWTKIPQEVADEMDCFTDKILQEMSSVEQKLGDVETAFVNVLQGKQAILGDIYHDENMKNAIGNVALKVYLRDSPRIQEAEAVEKVKKNLASLMDDFEKFMTTYIAMLGEQCISRIKLRGISLEDLRTKMKPKVVEITKRNGFRWHFDEMTYDLSNMKTSKKKDSFDDDAGNMFM